MVHTRYMTSRASFDGALDYQPLKLLYHYARRPDFRELMKVTHNFEHIFHYMTDEMINSLQHQVEKNDYDPRIIAFGKNYLKEYYHFKETGTILSPVANL